MSTPHCTAAHAVWLMLCLCLCLGATPARAQAQPAAAPGAASAAAAPSRSIAAADPGDVRAPVPPVRHRSAFAGYRPLGDVPATSWRGANDTVTRIGGWRTYTREAHAPEPAASAASAVPAGTPRGGHEHHGPAPKRGAP